MSYINSYCMSISSVFAHVTIKRRNKSNNNGILELKYHRSGNSKRYLFSIDE